MVALSATISRARTVAGASQARIMQGRATQEESMETHAVYVGIDVAKAALDVAVAPSGETWRTANAPEETAALTERLAATAPTLVVLEPTGGL